MGQLVLRKKRREFGTFRNPKHFLGLEHIQWKLGEENE
jgi:hypothetical protein